MLCRLCYTTCNAFKSLYEDNGHGNWLNKMAHEYFHPKIVDMDKAKHLTAICLKCFGHIYDFNNFQTSVMMAQMKLIEDGHYTKSAGTEDHLYTDDGSSSSQTPQVDNLQIKVENDCWDGLYEAESEDCGTGQVVTAVPNDWFVKMGPGEVLANRDLEFIDGITMTETTTNVTSNSESLKTAVEDRRIQTRSQRLSKTATAAEQALGGKDPNPSITPTISTSSPAHLSSAAQRGSPVIRQQATDDNCRVNTVNVSAEKFGEHIRTLENPNETAAVAADLDIKSEKIQIPVIYQSDSDIRQEYSSDEDDDAQEDTFKCTLCGKTHESASALRGHTITQHPENHHKLTCHVCDKQFNLKKGLELHHALVHKMVVKAAEFSITLCGLSQQSSKPVTVPMAKPPPDQNQKYVCELCNKSFNLEKGLELHNTWVHKPSAQAGVWIQEDELTNHETPGQRYEAAALALSSVRNVSLPELKVKMDNSDNDFSSDDDVPLRKCGNDHRTMRQHTENLLKFPCQWCNKEFNLEKGLELHHTLVHKPETGFQHPKTRNEKENTFQETISVCSDDLTRRQADNQKYACRLCNKVFNLEKGLELHKSLVHGLKPTDDGDPRWYAHQKSRQIQSGKRQRTGVTELNDYDNPSKIPKTINKMALK